jgi:hypothetical protein
MSFGTRVGVAALAVALASTLAGCGGGDDPSTEPTPSNTATTPTATPLTPREQAIDGAEAVLGRYYKVNDEVYSDPSKPLYVLESVMTATELGYMRHFYEGERRAGNHQTGTTSFRVIKVLDVSLDNSNPSKGVVPLVKIDVSKADVLDKDGHSTITKSRKAHGLARFGIGNYRYSSNPTGGWRVAWSQIKGDPCYDG